MYLFLPQFVVYRKWPPAQRFAEKEKTQALGIPDLPEVWVVYSDNFWQVFGSEAEALHRQQFLSWFGQHHIRQAEIR